MGERNVSPVTGLAIEFQGLSTNSPDFSFKRVTRSSRLSLPSATSHLNDNSNRHGNNDVTSNSSARAAAENLRRHSLSHVTRDLTAAPQKRQRSVSRTPSRCRASAPPPASPLTLPVGQEATSPVPKRSRNPGAVAATRASTGFSMVLRGSASAAFKPTALDTFKTPTSTRRISATKTPTLRVPSFSLSPAARTPTMRSTSVAAPAQKPFGITSSSPAGVSRLPDVTPTKGAPTTPRTSHTVPRRHTMDTLLFKSPLSPAEYSSPVLKKRRSANSISRGASQSPLHPPLSQQGKQVTTPSRASSVISPQDDGSRDSGVCMETGGSTAGGMSPIPFGLLSPDLDQGEVMEHSLDELACKPISTRRTLFGTDDDSTTTTMVTEAPKSKHCGLKRVRSSPGSSGSSMLRSSITPGPERPARRPLKTAWRRHHSDSEAMIKSAINRAESNDDLVGDYSRAHSLPTTEGGKHQDLRYISPETLFQVVLGTVPQQQPNNALFSNATNNADTQYVIIDCRYPYEYDGGHIAGALNLYTKDQVNDFLKEYHNNYPVTNGNKKNQHPNTVLIFHCEFSSERGPKMARFLRSQDRILNAEKYPLLSFPEIYIAEGGYKDFYHQFPTCCTPQGYTPMLHENHTEDLRQFRIKSRSWTAGEKNTPSHRRSRPVVPGQEEEGQPQSPACYRRQSSFTTPTFREKGRKLRL